jgi:hypothetical protein
MQFIDPNHDNFPHQHHHHQLSWAERTENWNGELLKFMRFFTSQYFYSFQWHDDDDDEVNWTHQQLNNDGNVMMMTRKSRNENFDTCRILFICSSPVKFHYLAEKNKNKVHCGKIQWGQKSIFHVIREVETFH